MGLFRGHANFSIRRRRMYYGVLGALGVLLFLSLRLLTTYRDAGMASYQRDRVADFRMQLQATLRSCQISAGRNPLLSGEDMPSLARGLKLLFQPPDLRRGDCCSRGFRGRTRKSLPGRRRAFGRGCPVCGSPLLLEGISGVFYSSFPG